MIWLPPLGQAASSTESIKQQVGRIAFIERPAHTRQGTNATMFAQVQGRGASIWVWDVANEAEPTQIFQTRQGMLFDISPSYDGQKLLLTYRTTPKEPFHIWEMNTDGSGLRQLTEGRYHDFNPVYYPDGRIVFCSSRVESYALCQDYLASALYIMQGDGSDMRRIDWTTLNTNAPSILPDGSILCTRWEYQDKNIFSWQGLWTVKPNGRQLSLYYGNTLTVPNSLYGPKPVPGTDQVVFTMAPHHYRPVGDIAIVDHHLGLENPQAARKLTSSTGYRFTQGHNWRDTNWGPGDDFYPNAYTDPWPIDKDLSLASYGRGRRGKEFELVIVTHQGHTFPLYHQAGRAFYCPVSLKPRPKPIPVFGDAPQEKGLGTFYVQDLYRGLREQGVQPGQIKALRIWEPLPKKYNTEGPRINDHYPLIGFGTYYVKYIHGTVPVTPEGTAYFQAPSNCELYFQALDQDGKEIIRMGSVTQITTGEVASCIGCHEHRDEAPAPLMTDAQRLSQAPDPIQPPAWGAGPVDYVKLVQPVWDRHCISCHSGPLPKADLDLSGDKTRFFSMSYLDLCRKNLVDYYWINIGPTGQFPALSTGSWSSRLTQILESGHHGIQVPAEDRRRIYAWIDSNVCYYGTWEMSRPHSMGGRDPWALPNTDRAQPWLLTLGDIVTQRNLKGFDVEALTTADNHAMINMTHPENSRLLSHNLPPQAGGLARPNRAMFKSKRDPDYQKLLKALQQGARHLRELPRMDMPNAVAVPQERDFGRTW